MRYITGAWIALFAATCLTASAKTTVRKTVTVTHPAPGVTARHVTTTRRRGTTVVTRVRARHPSKAVVVRRARGVIVVHPARRHRHHPVNHRIHKARKVVRHTVIR
jgi:hypothetical protein